MNVFRLPAVVALDADAVKLVLLAIAQAQRARARLDALPPSPRLDALARALAGACPSADMPEAPTRDTGGMNNPIDTAAAAELLGVSGRHARRLAPGLGGVKVGGTWLLDAAAVEEHRGGTDR